MAAPRSSDAAENGRGPKGKGRQEPPTPTLLVDRVLPNSAEAEKAVLGAFLLNPDEAGPRIREHLRAEHFYQPGHRKIYTEMAEMQDRLQAVDLLTLTQRLTDQKVLDDIGGPAYLAELVTGLPGLANLDHYIAIVAEKSLLRRMITCAARIVDHSFDRQENVKEWVDEVEKEMFDLTAEKSQRTAVPVSDVIKDAIAAIERLYDQHGMTGLPTGFRDLDRLTGGLHPGNLIIIAGRPSMGKTALAMNIAEHVAVDQQKPVGVFSLEMSTQELVIRLLCSRAKVNLRSVHDGFLKSESFHPLTATASELMKAPLYVDDSAALEINQVRSRARRMKLQHGIQLVVVDYLQLMRSPTPRSGTSRQVEIAEISGGLKALAKELQVPVIALSQLNRQPEQREGGTPRLSDLRESGAIEQDADMVGLLVRPEVYEDDADEKRAKEGEATLVIGKQRNGPTGEVQLTFLKEFTRFVDRARVEAEDIPDTGGQRE